MFTVEFLAHVYGEIQASESTVGIRLSIFLADATPDTTCQHVCSSLL